MKRHLLFAALLPALAATAQTSAPQALNNFAFRFYDQLDKKQGANFCVSPFSIGSAFAMTYAGAAGETEQEFQNAFSFGANDSTFHSSFATLNKLINGYSGRDKMELRTANKIYFEKTFPFEKPFLSTVSTNYGVSPEACDFKKNFESCRGTINSWVEDQTHKRIRNLLPAGSLTTDTRMVLVNALYLKAEWVSPFDSSRTHKEDFTGDDKKKNSVDMMQQTTGFRYANDDNFEVLDMPYKGNGLSMVIFLPANNKSLDDVRSKFTETYYTKLISGGMRYQRTEVHLPKFKADYDVTLSKPLKAMGMKKAFTDFADFSGMRKPKDVCISEAFHKTFIAVDENGTEAAAATAVVMIQTTSVAPRPAPPVIFRADHPFIYIIRENSTGAILFIGEMHSPSFQ